MSQKYCYGFLYPTSYLNKPYNRILLLPPPPIFVFQVNLQPKRNGKNSLDRYNYVFHLSSYSQSITTSAYMKMLIYPKKNVIANTLNLNIQHFLYFCSVRLFSCVFSLYFLALTMMPCVDIHATDVSVRTISIYTDHESCPHEKGTDFCSPFCNCSCCSQVVFLTTPLSNHAPKSNQLFATSKVSFANQFNWQSEYLDQLFHPPKV